MIRSDIPELHYITPIANLSSIMQLGILSNKRVEKIPHVSIAMEEVQDRRRQKKIPGAGHLHDYANLYFDAHNPMLSARRDMNDAICVLRIKSDALSLDGVIITDKNASRDCWFKSVAEGLPLLNKDEIYATFWLHDDFYEQDRRKGIKCAEALVPRCVNCFYIFGAFVANTTALNNFRQVSTLPVEINGSMFF